jgi:pimeloyl-ACP methyl ester carboxylesterase
MRTDDHNIELYYETFGFDQDPALLLINGLGSQLLGWSEEFCLGFVDRGFFVIRFDNRDIGLSSRLDESIEYDLSDMAADGLAVLDALAIDKAHVVGMSMGGMIVQTLAIEQPERLLTATSIMSSTGVPGPNTSTPEALAAINTPAPLKRAEAIALDIAHRKVWASPEWFDEQAVTEYFEAAWDRSSNGRPDRQMAAIGASGSREDLLTGITTPTLVIHGDEDTLIDISCGRRTAELIPGAEFLEIEGMGHDICVQAWPLIISSVTNLAARNA